VTRKNPIGVMPDWLWEEKYPSPTVGQLLRRYQDVSAAVDRYLEAALLPRSEWRRELGTVDYQAYLDAMKVEIAKVLKK
jgi:hypothetical protein